MEFVGKKSKKDKYNLRRNKDVRNSTPNFQNQENETKMRLFPLDFLFLPIFCPTRKTISLPALSLRKLVADVCVVKYILEISNGWSFRYSGGHRYFLDHICFVSHFLDNRFYTFLL